jgi:hypothetical protein
MHIKFGREWNYHLGNYPEDGLGTVSIRMHLKEIGCEDED